VRLDGPRVVGLGEQIVLDATFTDPGLLDEHLFQFRAVGPSGMPILNWYGESPTLRFQALTAGTWHITVTVEDGDGGTGTATAEVVVGQVIHGSGSLTRAGSLNASAAFMQRGASASTGGMPITLDYGLLSHGDFSVSPGEAVDAAWTLLGAATIADGVARLTEAGSEMAGLSQTFRISSGVKRLSFTLPALHLRGNGAGPGDAFEAALLNASGTASLVGTALLSGTDAFLNVQADGRTYASDRVSIAGLTNRHGGILDYSQPVTVHVDVTGLTVDAVARLQFDLIGMGERSSSVTIDDVAFFGTDDAPPAVTAAGLLSALSTTYGTASGETSVVVAGANLTGDIVATAPAGFEVSVDDVTYSSSATLTQAAGIASGTIYVRLAATTSVGTYSGNLTLLSTGLTDLTVVVPQSSVTARPITITVDAKSKTYGDIDPTLTYQLTSGTLVGTDALSGSLTRTAGENVGSYAINQGSVTAGSNYAITYAGANLTVAARPITVTADAKTKTYGDGDPALSYTLTSGTLVGTDALSGSLTRTAGENVGSYAINQGSVTAGSNYAITYEAENLAITPRPVTVTVDGKSKTYGDIDPAFTYQFTAGTLVGTDALSGSLTRAAGENVGTYAITQGSLDAGANYTVSFTGATLTVNPRPLTITGVSAMSRVYDGTTTAAVSGTAAYANLATGESFAVSGTPAATFTTKAAGVGKAVTVTGYTAPNANYTVSQPAGLTATITPKALTVTANNVSRVYGTNNPGFSATVSGFVTGETSATEITGNALVSSVAARTSGIGTYAVSVAAGTLASRTGNYSLTTFVPGTLTINKAAVTVRADNKMKVQNQADPTLTFSAFGLVGGDTPATAFSGGLSRVTGEAVGSYAINRGTLALAGTAAANYNLTFQSGTLKIEAAPRLFVTGAFVKGSTWTTDYLGLSTFTTTGGGTQLGLQLTDGAGQVADSANVTWSNVNRISVRFNQAITTPAANSLTLLAVTGATNAGGRGTQSVITSTAVAMSEGNTVATWTVPTLASGKYTLRLQPAAITSQAGSVQLDGDWTTSSSTFATGSGNGTAGGAFEFRFNVLVGDVVANGTVSASDVNGVKQRYFAAVSASNYRYDLNGNGAITSADGTVVSGQVGRTALASLGGYAPQLTAAAQATVDAAFAVTFTDDAAWRGAITGVRVGSTMLETAAYDRTVAGRITFTPAASTLLHSSGTKSITISAPGYADVTVSQALAAGVAAKLAVLTQPVGPTTSGGLFATQPVVRIQDQYGNTVSSTATVTAQVESGTGSWSLGGTTSLAAVAGTATFTNLMATRLVAGTNSGARIRFTAGGMILVISNAFTIPG
jgi:hypothetical protein